MARAFLKLGDHESSSTANQAAIQTANDASLFSERHHRDDVRYQNQSILSQMATCCGCGTSRCLYKDDAHGTHFAGIVRFLPANWLKLEY
jgi:hypothetical protein